MLAVVKEPHIELSIGGATEKISELLEFIRTRYTVRVLTTIIRDDGGEAEDIRETAYWQENATPGRILAGYRHKHELTQEQLAEKSGIHHVVISAYENGKRRITRRAAAKLAKALGEDADTFYARLNVA